SAACRAARFENPAVLGRGARSMRVPGGPGRDADGPGTWVPGPCRRCSSQRQRGVAVQLVAVGPLQLTQLPGIVRGVGVVGPLLAEASGESHRRHLLLGGVLLRRAGRAWSAPG